MRACVTATRLPQPRHLARALSLSLLLVVVVLLCCLAGRDGDLVTRAHAFPFPASSGVTELTPSTLDIFVQTTHKPVMVLFYAPWCGHCKRLHPDYTRLAQQMKGVARIGAINADTHRSLAARYGVRSFPTLKVWPASQRKRLLAPDDYAGERSVAAMQRYLLSGVRTDVVTRVHDASTLAAALRTAPARRAVVLFSHKARVPPILAVLAQSPRLRAFAFVFAGNGAANAVAAVHNVTHFPTLAVLRLDDADNNNNNDNDNGGDANTTRVPGAVVVVERTYSGTIAYVPIAQYLVAALQQQQDSSNNNTSAS